QGRALIRALAPPAKEDVHGSNTHLREPGPRGIGLAGADRPGLGRRLPPTPRLAPAQLPAHPPHQLPVPVPPAHLRSMRLGELRLPPNPLAALALPARRFALRGPPTLGVRPAARPRCFGHAAERGSPPFARAPRVRRRDRPMPPPIGA